MVHGVEGFVVSLAAATGYPVYSAGGSLIGSYMNSHTASHTTA